MTAALPTFTVICLCHNQARFVHEALDSVVCQDYAYPAYAYPAYTGIIELIIVDDASTDGSQEAIQEWLSWHPHPYKTIFLKENLGNCRAFNQALALAEGDFIIDLAADDKLSMGRLADHARILEQNPDAVMAYGDAWYVDAEGKHLYRQSDRVGAEPPEGDVFAQLFQGNFICPSTVTFRTAALKQLGGYDERLAFEDFDVWMRLARIGQVRYAPEVASLHRVSAHSLSGRFYRGGNPQMAQSVVRIGEKALGLARNEEERAAIVGWLRFQARLAAYTGYGFAVEELNFLHLKAVGRGLPLAWLWKMVAGLKVAWAYRLYLRMRYWKNASPVTLATAKRGTLVT